MCKIYDRTEGLAQWLRLIVTSVEREAESDADLDMAIFTALLEQRPTHGQGELRAEPDSSQIIRGTVGKAEAGTGPVVSLLFFNTKKSATPFKRFTWA